MRSHRPQPPLRGSIATHVALYCDPATCSRRRRGQPAPHPTPRLHRYARTDTRVAHLLAPRRSELAS